jgi:hypothetical protein
VTDEDKYVIDKITTELLPFAIKESKAYHLLFTVQNDLQHDKRFTVRKANRWIGYAQCLLVAEGSLTLDDIITNTRRIEESALELTKHD